MNSVIHEDKYGQYSVLTSPQGEEGLPWFSFIMSAYNADKTLVESLDSIREQTEQRWEAIIVDDGSTDKTRSILEDYCKKDRRFVLVCQSNIGLTKSLNRALTLVRGKVVVRQDADDISFRDRLEVLFQETSKPKWSGFLASSAILEEEDGQKVIVPRASYTKNRHATSFGLNFGNPIVHGTLAFDAELIKHHGYTDSCKYSQDYDLLLRLLASNVGFCYVEKPLYVFRKSSTSISSAKREQQAAIAREILRKNRGSDFLYLSDLRGFSRVWRICVREVGLLLCRAPWN